MENSVDELRNVFICSHPLVQVSVSELRSIDTNSLKFRRLIKEISRYVVYESLIDTELKSIKVQTPLAITEGHDFKYNFILAPILRAGLSMIDGAIETLPFAQVRHIGLYRNEETLQPVEYYVKLPDQIDADTTVLILDPMLATGGSAISAIDVFKRRGVKKLKFLCLISSKPGIQALLKAHPDIQIYTASIDPELNENGYIIPGLGDAGDRCFGT
ncbi:MAG: uracil phosphoribosyltransferase [Candidatus Sericytochromatia bacterium]|nr:uracil phosphoribosyltransferase [Candidatus Sericytochromatia bacterium]